MNVWWKRVDGGVAWRRLDPTHLAWVADDVTANMVVPCIPLIPFQ